MILVKRRSDDVPSVLDTKTQIQGRGRSCPQYHMTYTMVQPTTEYGPTSTRDSTNDARNSNPASFRLEARDCRIIHTSPFPFQYPSRIEAGATAEEPYLSPKLYIAQRHSEAIKNTSRHCTTSRPFTFEVNWG